MAFVNVRDTQPARQPPVGAMKAGILGILKKVPQPVSGQWVSARLGVSRVTVWKHIQALQQLGYGIVAGPAGYRLERVPDVPFPWEVPGWERQLHYLEETPSTMDRARTLAREGCPDLTVVTAGRQRRGRGRLQRRWSSEPGGLYFTVVTRPRLPAVHSSRVCFAAGWVLARVLREHWGVPAGLKWPNDIVVNGSKLAGMLSEMEARDGQVRFVNLGIGVNVRNRVPVDVPGAVSLSQLVPDASVTGLLKRFLEEWRAWLQRPAWDTVVADWKVYAVTVGRCVTIVTGDVVRSGTVEDVDPDGALVLRDACDRRHVIHHGDCFP